jgi:hypothetical protein
LIIVLEFGQQASHTRVRPFVRHGVVERRGVEVRRAKSERHRPDNATVGTENRCLELGHDNVGILARESNEL